MDRIEMLIVALIGVQSDITSDLHAGFSWENLKEYRVRRTAIRTQIADEYRAMVAALEKVISRVYLPEEWEQDVVDVLARVKGE